MSTYLTVTHYTEPTALSCPDTGIVNCTKVTTSSASMLFGVVPVALAGTVFFAVMLALTVPPAWRWRPGVLRPLRLAGALAGMGMVVYLVWVEVWDLRAICLWCTAAHVFAFVLFVVVLSEWLLSSVPVATKTEPPVSRPLSRR